MTTINVLDAGSTTRAIATPRGTMTAQPTAFSMALVNDAITATVEAGTEISFCLAVPNFIATGTFQVEFEKFDGTSWTACTVIPKTLIGGAAGVTNTTAIGMWRYTVELGITQIRLRLSAISTLTSVWGWVELFEDGRKVHLPFAGLTSGTFAIATNNPIVPAINWDRLGDVEIDIQAFAGTSQTLTWQSTNDDSGANWGGAAHIITTGATPTAGTSTTAAGAYKITPGRQYFRANLTYTALTAMAINGIVSTVTSSVAASPIIVAGGPVAAGATTGLGNPFASGFQCQTAALTTADANNRLTIPVTTPGRQTVVRPGQLRAAQSQGTITLSTTTETTLLAAVASLFQDITELDIDNTSASPVRVDFRTTTAGAVVLSVTVAAGSHQRLTWKTGLLQAAVNTNWTAQLSAAVTDVRITAVADRWVG